MDDPAIHSLPDDPLLLKQIILQRDSALGLCDIHIEELKRQAAERIAQLQEQNQQIKLEMERIESLRRQQVAELELEQLRLRQQLLVAMKKLYGPRGDRLASEGDVAQLLLEFAVELEARPVDVSELPSDAGAAQIDPKTVRRVKRRGRRNLGADEFDHLPVIRKEHDLADEDKACPCCNQPRVKIGEESSWQIEYMPGFFQRVEHVRIKYACRGCEQNAMNPNIELADKPVQPIEKGMAGPGLLAYVVTSKFADYLPLYRLENIFARNGFEIDRVTQCLWCRDVADIVKPLYDRMGQRVLASHVIQTDDTVMPMLQPGQTKQARMWVYVGDQANPYNLFDFTLSRSRDGPAQFLKGYNQTIVADAYGGYDGICLEAGITQAGCWAHARRKFVDTRDLSPKIADEALLLIGKLFAIEQTSASSIRLSSSKSAESRSDLIQTLRRAYKVERRSSQASRSAEPAASRPPLLSTFHPLPTIRRTAEPAASCRILPKTNPKSAARCRIAAELINQLGDARRVIAEGTALGQRIDVAIERRLGDVDADKNRSGRNGR